MPCKLIALAFCIALTALLVVCGDRRRFIHRSSDECEKKYLENHVVFVFLFMLLPAFFKLRALRHAPITYTAGLLVFGFAFGYLHIHLSRPHEDHELEIHSHESWKKFAIGVDIWQKISPDLLHLIFVPALLFCCSFSLDFHVTRRIIGQSLLLALPGAIICIILTSVFVKYVFPYEWCWPKAVMFGAMVSAIDPVAVVTLLKQVGASRHLGTLIETESLFNGETTIFCFLLFKNMIPVTRDCLNDKMSCLKDEEQFCQNGVFVPSSCARHFGYAEIVLHLLKVSLGGPAVGFLSGIVTTLWIQYTYNDKLTEILLTIVSPYLTFLMAEMFIVDSGALAVIVLGLFMGSFAKNRISPQVYHHLHTLWALIENLSMTVIFVFGGLKIAVELFETTGEHGKNIQAREWGYAVLLYIVLQLIRFITVFVLMPLLERMGYGMTCKDALVISWSGLRGALGMTLAITVQLDVKNIPHSFRSYTIFYLGFITAATVMVNGISMPYLFKVLGVTKSSAEKTCFLHFLCQKMERNGMNPSNFEDAILGAADQEKLKELTDAKLEEYFISYTSANITRETPLEAAESVAHMHLANSAYTCLREPVEPRPEPDPDTGNSTSSTCVTYIQSSLTQLIRKALSKQISAEDASNRAESVQSRLRESMRYRLLHGVRAAYGEYLNKQFVTPNVMFDLKNSIDVAIDQTDKPVCDWDFLKKIMHPPQWRCYLQKWKGYFKQEFIGPAIDRFLSSILLNSLMDAVLLANAFIMAHGEAEHALHEHMEEEIDSNDPQTDHEKAKILKDTVMSVILESRQATEEAHQTIRTFRVAYPNILRPIKTRLAAMEILLAKRKFIEEIERVGIIEKREAVLFGNMIESKIKYIHYKTLTLELPNQRVLLEGQLLFVALSKTVFANQVAPHAKFRTLNQNETIFHRGDEPDCVTIILQGHVKMITEQGEESFVGDGFGSAVGLTEVLLNCPRKTTLRCERMTEFYQIDKNYFLDTLMKIGSIKLHVWQMAGLLLTYLNPWGSLVAKSLIDLGRVFKRAELLEFNKDEELKIQSLAYILSGTVIEARFDQNRNQPITGPAPLPSGLRLYFTRTEVKILRLATDFVSMTVADHELSVVACVLHRPSSTFQRKSWPLQTRLPSEPMNQRRPFSSFTVIDIDRSTAEENGRSQEIQEDMDAGEIYVRNDFFVSADLETRNFLGANARRMGFHSFEV